MHRCYNFQFNCYHTAEYVRERTLTVKWLKCCKDSSKGRLDNNVNAVTCGSTDSRLSVVVVLGFSVSKSGKQLHSSSGLL